MNVNDLDNLSLLMTFKKLTHQELLVAGRVCGKWNFIRSKEAASRSSFTLLVGANAVNLIRDNHFIMIPFGEHIRKDDGTLMFAPNDADQNTSWDHIQIDSLTQERVELLAELFQNVSSVAVSVFTKPKDLEFVASLLNLLNSKIVSLQVFVQYPDEIISANYSDVIKARVQILDSINSMKELKFLTLSGNFNFAKGKTGCVNLPILSQLNKFNFASTDKATRLINHLVKYGVPNKNLSAISLRLGDLDFANDQWKKLDGEFMATRFKHMLHHWQIGMPEEYRFINAFQALTTLDIAALKFPVAWAQMVQSLSPFKQLVDFRLHTSSFYLAMMQEFNSEQHNEVITSVKLFTLTIEGGPAFSHNSALHLFQLHHYFPKLQVVSIKTINDSPIPCYFCKLHSDYYHEFHEIMMNGFGRLMDQLGNPTVSADLGLRLSNILKESDETEQACLREFIKPLRECKELVMVHTRMEGCEPKEWSAEELKNL